MKTMKETVEELRVAFHQLKADFLPFIEEQIERSNGVSGSVEKWLKIQKLIAEERSLNQ